MSKYSGAGWIKAAWKSKPIGPFGEQVADLLGDVYLGIYHLNKSSLLKAEWDNPRFIEVNIDGSMSTYDDDILTRIVVLAHDRCIRVAISPNMRYLKLTFTPRERVDSIFNGHPTLETHVDGLRKHYGEVSNG